MSSPITSTTGGADQAIYVYGTLDYDWWSRELGEEIAPGSFGENLSIGGLESTGFAIGDRLLIGDELVLEVSAPRIPCAVLAARMRSAQFVRRFRDAERPGLYCWVIAEGGAERGDAVKVAAYAGERVTALEVFRDTYAPSDDEAVLRRFLSAPLAERARNDKLAQLERLLTPVR